MRVDGTSGRIDSAGVPDPPVAASGRPFIKPDAVARLVALRRERVKGQLPAGVVQQQVVGLRHVIDARTRSPRLDHVHCDSQIRRHTLTGGTDNAFERAESPRTQSHDRYAHKLPPCRMNVSVMSRREDGYPTKDRKRGAITGRTASLGRFPVPAR